MKANCEPPENSRRLRAAVCGRSRPAATASAPNDTPYRPVANETDTACRIASRTAGLRSGLTSTLSHTIPVPLQRGRAAAAAYSAT